MLMIIWKLRIFLVTRTMGARTQMLLAWTQLFINMRSSYQWWNESLFVAFLTLDFLSGSFCCIKSHPPEMFPPSKKILANLILQLLWSYLDCDFCVCCSFGPRTDLEFPPYKQKLNHTTMNSPNLGLGTPLCLAARGKVWKIISWKFSFWYLAVVLFWPPPCWRECVILNRDETDGPSPLLRKYSLLANTGSPLLRKYSLLANTGVIQPTR